MVKIKCIGVRSKETVRLITKEEYQEVKSVWSGVITLFKK